MNKEWTQDRIDQLTQMCMDGISNATMAVHFGVPVTDIHAKRSQLGITIPKIRALKETGIVGDHKKKYFVDALETLLKKANCDVVRLSLSEDCEYVFVHFTDGYTRKACIAADSNLAIIKDVIRVLE